MKKIAIFLTLSLLAMSLVFSSGANEKAYDSFWSFIEYNYPLYNAVSTIGLDTEEMKEQYRTRFTDKSSEEEMTLIFRSIATKFMALDYIDVSQGSTDASADTTSKSEVNSPRTQYIPSLRTVIITIPSFSLSEFSDDYITSSLSSLSGVDNIIFDVTGNSTGGRGWDLGAVLSGFGGSWTYTYRAYFRNRTVAENLFSSDEIKETENSLLKDEYDLPFYVDITRSYDYGEGTLNAELKNAKRWILVDEETSYTADYLASFAEATGWATVVGRNTSGNGTGLPFIQTQLPGYDITIACSAAAVTTPVGSLKALTGTAPDIVADDGRSALKVCLTLIEENLQ